MRVLLGLAVALNFMLVGSVDAATKRPFPTVESQQLPPIVRYTRAPVAAQEFITRAPTFGKYLSDHKAKTNKPLKYDARLATLLQQVNTEGNTKITWKSDINVYGKPEYWDMPCESNGKLYDDCDGYAIWKMHRLIELGLPSTPLIFATAYDETKTYHAILIVMTDKGDFVLDNRNADVKTVTQLQAAGYNFISRTAVGDRFDGNWIDVQPMLPIPQTIPALPSPGASAPEPLNPLCPR